MRWAAFEAATCAARRGSPDHVYYRKVAAELDGKQPTLAMARKLLRRSYHTVCELGDPTLAPIDTPEVRAA